MKSYLSYQKSLIVFDGTVSFCRRFIDPRDRTYDQMIQAARSGKQNIIEGSQASGTSKEMEIKLTNVRAPAWKSCWRIIATFCAAEDCRSGDGITAIRSDCGN